MMRCLGKHPVRHDKRTIHLKDLMSDLPTPPPARNWADKLPDDVGMYMNDQIGDCTCASAAHLVQLWTAQVGVIVNPLVQDVQKMYERFGYDPSDPSTDQGANMLDVLNSWRKEGLGSDKIGAYAKMDHKDIDHVKATIDYFGGIYVGAELPIRAQNAGDWSGPPAIMSSDDRPGGWGGHCMAGAAYDRSGVTFLTWGRRQFADWQWWLDYVDEAYAVMSPDWLDGTGVAPVGLPVAQLNQYLSQL